MGTGLEILLKAETKTKDAYDHVPRDSQPIASSVPISSDISINTVQLSFFLVVLRTYL